MNSQRKEILFSVVYILSALFSSIISWWLLNGESKILLLIMSAFVIPSLFPSVGTFLMMILRKANLSVAENQSVDINPTIISESETISLSTETPNPIVKKQVIEKPIQFVLENENGKILLDVPIKNIICFEANDNYVVTYYLDREERLKKSMERISLKRIEEIVEGLKVDSFTRVHKSYLINRSYLEEIRGKAQAHKLKMIHLEILIPVSRAYPINTLRDF
jgi:hypothetical protein